MATKPRRRGLGASPDEFSPPIEAADPKPSPKAKPQSRGVSRSSSTRPAKAKSKPAANDWKKVLMELRSDDHRQLVKLGVEYDASAVEIVRALIHLRDADAELAAQVEQLVRNGTFRRERGNPEFKG